MKTKMYILTVASLLSINAFAGRESGGLLTLKLRCMNANTQQGKLDISVISNYSGEPGSTLSATILKYDVGAEWPRAIADENVDLKKAGDELLFTGNETYISVNVTSIPQTGVIVYKDGGDTVIENIVCSYNKL
jgi:hypothetical protein